MDKLLEIAEKLISNPEYTFWGLALLIPFAIAFLWGKVKEVGMLKDVSSLIARDKKNKIIQLKARIDQGTYLPREKELFEYELKVYEYQELLKTNESHLPTLIYLNGFENAQFAVDAYQNSQKFLKFNDFENKFELKKSINPRFASGLRKTGGFIFIVISLSAYILMMYFLYLHEELGVGKNYIGLWAFCNFMLMIIMIVVGMKIMKFLMKRQQALDMFTLTRINTKYGDNIEK